jgi:hypothetical protein
VRTTPDTTTPVTAAAVPDGPPPEVLPVSVVVPVRHAQPDPDLAARLGALAGHVAEVIVVDGSEPDMQDAHARTWPATVRQVRLADEDRTPMGKVGGVLAGAREAGHDILVVADDDVVWHVPALAVGAVAVAEAGRRRADGRSSFPPTAALWAPLWVGERAITSWLAVGSRLRGGVRYRDGRLRTAAGPPPRRGDRRRRRVRAAPGGEGARP